MGNHMPNNSENYLGCVQECLNVLMEYGTDRYGPKHLPILVSILDVESRGSTAGYIPSSEIFLDKTVVASKCANVVAGAGSVKSSAGT